MANPRLEIRGTLEERHEIWRKRQPGMAYPPCPNCGDGIPTTYNKPIYGSPSGHFERTGDCRTCGPVTLKSGLLSDPYK